MDAKKRKRCRNCGGQLPSRRWAHCSQRCSDEFFRKKDRIRHYYDNRKIEFSRRKNNIVEKLGKRCVSCGNTDVRVLEIDHIDPSKKGAQVKRHDNWTRRLVDWERQIHNLQLLCANCHRVRTYEQLGWGQIKDSQSPKYRARKKVLLERKSKLLESLGGKCTFCKSDDQRILDIDHIDPATKINKTTYPCKRWSWERRFRDWLANIGNLRLLCVNCHRIHTAKVMVYCT